MGEIVKVDSQLVSRFGDTRTFEWMMQRQAEIYQVPWADVQQYADVRGALIKATQWAWSYGAMPGKHIFLIPFNVEDKKSGKWRKTYAVSDSYEWRKASADDKARELKQQYMVQTEQLTADALRAYVASNKLGGPYDETDRGFRARVLFRHEIDMCKVMGIAYNPPWHYGFWRRNADFKKEKWQADNIPEGRTPEWVAMKRAEKSALAQHFELRPLRGWAQASDDQRVAAIQDAVTRALPEPDEDPRHRALVARSPVVVDEDGLILERAPVPQDVEFYTPAQPADDKAEVLAAWGSASNKAKAWAVDHGLCENATLAGEIWRNLAAERFNNKLTAQNLGEMMSAFYDEVTKEAK